MSSFLVVASFASLISSQDIHFNQESSGGNRVLNKGQDSFLSQQSSGGIVFNETPGGDGFMNKDEDSSSSSFLSQQSSGGVRFNETPDDAKEPCRTVQDKACQIPFFYQGYMHYECAVSTPGGGGELFGRCPTVLVNEATREPSVQRSDWERCGRFCPLQEYTSNSNINSFLRSTVREYPGEARLVTLGCSVKGQEILGVSLSTDVHTRTILKPMVRYVGNMHGNEPVGRELLLHLVTVLLQGYRVDARIRSLLDKTHVTIIPTMNPDGFERGTEGECTGADFSAGRYNEGDRDLNRDFPTWKDVGKPYSQLIQNRQPETKAMMDLILKNPWVLSANFHGGAVVASYPFDDYRSAGEKGVERTKDHEFFKFLASTYAVNHLTMQDQTKCTKWHFQDGITNGAEWYPLVGGMQDFNYLFTNGMEITLEVSCCKYPSKYYLNNMWEENRESLLVYLEQVHRGLKGLVVLESGVQVSAASVQVQNLETGEDTKEVQSSLRGEYWKLLLPGNYRIRAVQDNCRAGGNKRESQWIQVNISAAERLVRPDLTLEDSPCTDGGVGGFR